MRANDGGMQVLKELETDYVSTSIDTKRAVDLGSMPNAFLEVNTTDATGLGGGTTQTLEIFTAVRNRATDYFLVTTLYINTAGTTSTWLTQLGRYVAYKSELPAGGKPEWDMLLVGKS